jgi:hypothetical protein
MKICFAFFILLSVSSCKVIERKLFSPTQINNPSLEKKNDHSFSLAYSLPSGFDFTGGYAITNRLAIIGGAYSHKNSDEEKTALLFSNDNSSASLLYRHKGYHAGLGIYLPLSKERRTETFTSFFAGYTQGSFRMDERYFENSSPNTNPPTSTPTRISFYSSNIGRYFLQGGLNLYVTDHEVSFICRYNYVNYSDISTDYSVDQQQNFNFPPLGNPRHSQFLDFAFDTKIFFTENPKIGLQIFGSATTRLSNRDRNFRYYPFRLGIGLVIKNLLSSK